MEKQYLDYEGLERFKSKLVLGDFIQVTELPSASAEELGKVYQYIGATTSTLIHNYFYECVSDGESTPTYSWEQKDVQPGGGESVKWVDELPTGSAIENIIYATRCLQYAASEEFVWTYTIASDPISYASWPVKTKYTGKVYLYYNNTWNTVAEINTRVTSGELVSLTFRSGSGSATDIATYNVGETFTIKITGDDTAFFYAGDSENGVLTQVDNKINHFPTPSSTLEGKIYQYIGDDDNANGFYNGLSYTCVSDEESTPTYYWIPTEEWTGTHSAWEALPQTIKNHYHQKKVNFTDEDTGGIETVVDAVTDGDMHAVSSNAVYDKFNNLIKIKKITVAKANYSNGLDMTSRVNANLDAGYKFLSWINISSSGWIMQKPVYMASADTKGGYPYTYDATSIEGDLDMFYLEIKS